MAERDYWQTSLQQHRGLAQVAEPVTEDMLSLGASSLFANKEYIEEETAKPLCEEIKHRLYETKNLFVLKIVHEECFQSLNHF